MKKTLLLVILAISFITTESRAQVKVYRSAGGEVIISGADMQIIPNGSDPATTNPVDVNTNARFTLFFHEQQLLNMDLNNKIGFYTGAAIRNVGLIQEDLYQYMGFTGIDNTPINSTHPNWNKNTRIKRRSYSLGFPLALKLGLLDKHYFLYAGGEYEWMFHYKQKQFIDDNKTKYAEWTSDRVNSWIPSFFAGVQFPGGINLKFKYYLKDFLNTDFQGLDFGENVDYSQFKSSGIWYISMAFVFDQKQIKKMLEAQPMQKTAYRQEKLASASFSISLPDFNTSERQASEVE
ncbi:MAG: hypothetical protein V2B15_18990 [Bacteroidota bacterium]